MHSLSILLIKAEDRDEVRSKVHTFMERYEGQAWDWYVIGGRWSGVLNSKCEQFMEEVHKRFKPEHSIGYSVQEMEKYSDQFQALWEELGGTGNNPYTRDTYATHGDKDDIIPLKDCIDIVKKTQGNLEEQITNTRKKVEEARIQDSQNPVGAWKRESMYLRDLADLIGQNFHFGCSVYNVEFEDFSIPEETEEWFAVALDLHN